MSVWEGDVSEFAAHDWQGRVDCIHAGFPCQDISVAGNKAGVAEGTRSGLYREVLRIADEVQPEYIFLENVAAIVTLDDGAVLRTVVGDLASRGYDAVWTCLSAAEIGANHKRDRWWCLGYPKSKSSNGSEHYRKNSKSSSSEFGNRSGSTDMGYPNSASSEGRRLPSRVQERYEPNSGCSQEYWQSGWWEVEPDVGRVANGIPNTSHRLKGLGNAQVPLQAATAFSLLWDIRKEVTE
jgi:DNA (cytosine-5)-methyltransferase 1